MIKMNILTTLLSLTLLFTLTHASSQDLCQPRSLGLEDGRITPDQIRASSSHEPNTVGANNGRLNVDSAGGAWCPRGLVDAEATEFIEVDLKTPHLITAIQTQGRFGNGHGQEFAQAFVLDYVRPGLANYTRYLSQEGRSVLEANTNTYSVVDNELDSPVVATKLRIRPFSKHPRTVCMRIEIIGCRFAAGVVSYSATSPYRSDPDAKVSLSDDSFDGVQARGRIRQGLGQLIDGVVATKDTPDDQGVIGGYPWVGWKNESARPVELVFYFDHLRRFSTIQLFSHPKTQDMGYVTKIGLECGLAKYSFTNLSPDVTEMTLRPTDNKCQGRFVRLLLSFSGKWMALSEVTFDSQPVDEEQLVDQDVEEDKVVIDNQTNIVKTETPTTSDSFWNLSGYLGMAIGVFVTVIVILLIIVCIVVHKQKRTKPYSSVSNLSSHSRHSFAQSFIKMPESDDNAIYSEPHFGQAPKSCSTISGHLPLLPSNNYEVSPSPSLNSPTLGSRHWHRPPQPDWQHFFPGPPATEPPPASSIVPCYASTEILKGVDPNRWP